MKYSYTNTGKTFWIRKIALTAVLLTVLCCLTTGCAGKAGETAPMSDSMKQGNVLLPDPSVYMGGVLKTPMYESSSFMHGFEVYDPGLAMHNAYVKLLTGEYGMKITKQEDNRITLKHGIYTGQKLIIDVVGYDSGSGMAQYTFTGNCTPIKAEICGKIPQKPKNTAPKESPKAPEKETQHPSGSGSRKESSCHYCGGDGRCNDCGGSGYVMEYMAGRRDRARVRCTRCNGGRCRPCGGDGKD